MSELFSTGPSKEEIEDMENEAIVLSSQGSRRYPGATYEDGVKAALTWVTGNSDEPPLDLP